MSDEGMSKTGPGWYPLDGGGQGYWDGERWVSAVPEPTRIQQLTMVDVVAAVMIGMLLAWGIIYAGARFVSDDIFFPVKVVVDQQKLDALQDSLRP